MRGARAAAAQRMRAMLLLRASDAQRAVSICHMPCRCAATPMIYFAMPCRRYDCCWIAAAEMLMHADCLMFSCHAATPLPRFFFFDTARCLRYAMLSVTRRRLRYAFRQDAYFTPLLCC